MSTFKVIVVMAFMAMAYSFQLQGRGSHQNMMRMMAEEKKFSFMDRLSGKAQVAAARAADPNMFSKKDTKKVNAKGSVKITPNAQEAIDIFRKAFPKPAEGSSRDLTDKEIAFAFSEISKFVKDDSTVLKMLKISPSLIANDLKRSADNFDVYEETFGFDGAIGLITRNPNILLVRLT
jgi:hypothetical protein